MKHTHKWMVFFITVLVVLGLGHQYFIINLYSGLPEQRTTYIESQKLDGYKEECVESKEIEKYEFIEPTMECMTECDSYILNEKPYIHYWNETVCTKYGLVREVK